MKPPLVSVIIINWNGKADTLECLASLAADAYLNKEIIAVDNGSADDSVSAIRSAFPAVRVIETGENLGFTGGNNAGLRDALQRRPDYVYFLNNDTTSEPTATSELVAAAEANPEFGLLAPVIHYFDRPEEVWFGGAKMDLRRGIATHDNSKPPARGDPIREIPWATGCAMFMRTELAERLGGFDDRYFLICEDADLSLRVRAAGAKIGLTPAARIHHKVSRSFTGLSAATSYYSLRNKLLLLREHGGLRRRRAAAAVTVEHVRCGLRGARHGGTSRASAVQPVFRAVRDHFLGRYGRRGGARATRPDRSQT